MGRGNDALLLIGLYWVKCFGFSQRRQFLWLTPADIRAPLCALSTPMPNQRPNKSLLLLKIPLGLSV